MATVNYGTASLMELATLAGSGDAKAKEELARRDASNGEKKGTTETSVVYNASGQIYIREADNAKTAISKTGSVYNGAANIDLSIIRLLCADTLQAVELRKRVLALANVSKAEREKLVAAAAQRKIDNAAKGVQADRKKLQQMITDGICQASALEAFDIKHKLVEQPAEPVAS